MPQYHGPTYDRFQVREILGRLTVAPVQYVATQPEVP
jgi:hypothetical protein